MDNKADSNSLWPNRARSATTVHSNGPYDPPVLATPATPDEAAAGYAAYEFRRALAKIEQAADEKALFWVANSAFGPNNFCNRFGEALAYTMHHHQTLVLLKLMMHATLEDHLTGRSEWPASGTRSLGFGGPELWEVGQHLRYARISLLNEQNPLKKAAETRDALLVEIHALLSQPSALFSDIRPKLAQNTYDHWQRYLEKAVFTQSQADAGWSLGMVLADVLSALSAAMKRGVKSANLAAALPALSNFASDSKT